MERQKYRLNLSFAGMYREIELTSDDPHPTVVGTTRNCNVRLSRENFFRDFEISIRPGDDVQWDLMCSDSCYISQNGVLKLHRLTMQHGDSFSICYQDGDAELCHGEFLRDFETVGNAYLRYVALDSLSSLRIGGTPECQFYLQDPAVGPGFVELSRAAGDVWQLTDHGVRYGVNVNGNRTPGPALLHPYEFFSVSGHSFYLQGVRLYFCNDPVMSCQALRVYEHKDSATQMQYPYLNRSTRIYYRLPEDKLSIKNPQSKKQPPRQNLMMTILPMVIMLLMTVLLRGVMDGGGTFVIFSVCSMSIGMVTTILNYRREKKETTAGEESRVRGYTAYIQKKDEEFAQERQREISILETNTPNIEASLQTVWRFDNRLYERQPRDPDFLSVRLGSGPRVALCPIEINQEEYKVVDDPLTEWPEQVEAKYHTLPNAPVLLPLHTRNTVGVLGSEMEQDELVKLMTLDLCIRHSYLDVRLCFFLPTSRADTWSWVRWLRHVSNHSNGTRNIAYDMDSYKVLSEMLFKELSDREARAKNNADVPLPHYVVFVLDIYDLMCHPLSRFFGRCCALGVTFVFCRCAAELLPQCQTLVYLQNGQGQIVDAEDGNVITPFTPDAVTDEQAARVAVKLASVTVDEVSLASQLTKNITLYHMLHIFSASDLDLDTLWQKSQVYKSMAAPLGVNTKGEIIYLDLHEKAHGPHGLVAGTTGSGKSEILQSYILSMATLFHPYDVGFVIIDFKGGGMVNQFRELPHLIGSITDIDGREINRSLLSIRAELNKRKELFAQAGVNHIDQYIKKFKNGELTIPLPHLILIVDEFAELKAEQPEFMKELISTARVGRSLGVHLILATQKPAGVVDAQIWSNSRFRLCLKVATPEDSKEILKTPSAAEIREPGRAYLQVGNNEIFELFQSAFSGAAADSEITTGQRSYEIDRIDLAGVRSCLYKVSTKVSHQNKQTQLQEMVGMFRDYCAAHSIAPLPGICMPPLPDIISCPSLTPSAASGQISVPLGVYDDPGHQVQREYCLSLNSSHILIVGASLSGKSGLLYQFVRALSTLYTPKEVNLYIVDFASRALGIFSGLNHVGGCVFNDQEDRLKTFMRMLVTTVQERKERFSQVGITSYTGFREAGLSGDMPQIVVLLDNLIAFRELYPQYDENLLYLLREGISVGICFVVTAVQSSSISFRYMNTFGTRLALHCNDSSEYLSLLDHCRMQPKNVPGRAIISMNKECYEMQTYQAFKGEQEIERVHNIHAFEEEIHARFGSSHARTIPEVPDDLTEKWLLENDARQTAYTVSLGMAYDTVEYVRLPLATLQMLAISGTENSGRTNAILLILNQLQRQVLNAPVDCYILDGYDRKLAGCQRFGVVKRYTSDISDAAELLDTLRDVAQERRDWLRDGETERLQQAPPAVFIVRNSELYTDKKLDPLFTELFKLCRGLKITFIFGNVENAQISYTAGGILKAVRDNRTLLFLDKLENLRMFELPPAMLRSNKANLRTGDGYWLHDGTAERIRVARARSV